MSTLLFRNYEQSNGSSIKVEKGIFESKADIKVSVVLMFGSFLDR